MIWHLSYTFIRMRSKALLCVCYKFLFIIKKFHSRISFGWRTQLGASWVHYPKENVRAEHLPVVPLLIPEGQCPFRSLGVVTSNKPDHRGELTAANTAPFNFRLALNFRNSSTVSGKCDLEAKRSRSEIQGCRKASSTVIRSIGSIRSICRTKSLAWSLMNCHLELFRYSFPRHTLWRFYKTKLKNP